MTSLIASHYSLVDRSPPELPTVDLGRRFAAAAAAGFDGVGLSAWEYRSLRRSGWSPDDVGSLADRHLITIAEVELLTGWTHRDPTDRNPTDGSRPPAGRDTTTWVWEMVEVLRPHHLIVGDPTPTKPPDDVVLAGEAFGRVCDRAQDHGVAVGIEFVPGTAFPDLASAISVAEAANRPNGGVVIDLFHHLSSGSSEELAAAAHRVVGVQLSDHTLPTGQRSHFDEWRHGGVALGAGVLDVRGAIDALRAGGFDGPWSVEVLSDAMRAKNVETVAVVLASGACSVLDNSPTTSPTGETD